ncbi:hypothetical protein QE364_000729 [Nocardioides zeae]|uniref:Uncharacterized protein n=1 Tax=Nocardioides zeae TaxID=1457234 RepID=A0ACC6IEI2_9ACTN|nr:hypothetical protein [Nocardioides zeae]MDR6174231.1 hypothetical protein [Nocardioides zeae]MDR6209037.1 hypothetical protein [Nocardioides zeae]
MKQREPSGLWVYEIPCPPQAPSPPPPRASRVVVGTMAVVGVLVAGCLAFLAVAFYEYADHDRLEFIEDDTILFAINPVCAEVERLGDQIARPAEDLERRRVQVDAVLAAARPIPATVLALDDDVLDGDQPARAWAADWERVIDALTVYRQSLDDDPETAVFRMPSTEDGYTLTFRMDTAVEGCVLPAAIESLAEDPPRSAAEAEHANGLD